jgi:radical SAM modification target selenobiotic family peptide
MINSRWQGFLSKIRSSAPVFAGKAHQRTRRRRKTVIGRRGTAVKTAAGVNSDIGVFTNRSSLQAESHVVSDQQEKKHTRIGSTTRYHPSLTSGKGFDSFQLLPSPAPLIISISVPAPHHDPSVCRVPAPGELNVLPITLQETTMDANDLKKILAGFCIAGLVAGSTFTLNGCASGKSA